jgi:hypothetical protein
MADSQRLAQAYAASSCFIFASHFLFFSDYIFCPLFAYAHFQADAAIVLSLTRAFFDRANRSSADDQAMVVEGQAHPSSNSAAASTFPAEHEGWIQKLAVGAGAVISPMATIFGGIIAQEILKATSSKYTPIKQWLFFESLECLPSCVLDEKGMSGASFVYLVVFCAFILRACVRACVCVFFFASCILSVLTV